MSDWRANIIEDDDAIGALLRGVRRIAVLGIKPESRAAKPAHYVPAYLQRAGFEIVPVPVYYPDVDEILGERVYRTVAAIPGPVDLVEVFRKPGDIPPHVPDLIAKRPKAVWFQSGIRNDAAAEALARAGIVVVQDRCLMVEHRRLSGAEA
ncbi:MAG TPA: CoA-binding protein [Longimicrobiales bacterium]